MAEEKAVIGFQALADCFDRSLLDAVQFELREDVPSTVRAPPQARAIGQAYHVSRSEQLEVAFRCGYEGAHESLLVKVVLAVGFG
jgi:hypothetical protein